MDDTVDTVDVDAQMGHYSPIPIDCIKCILDYLHPKERVLVFAFINKFYYKYLYHYLNVSRYCMNGPIWALDKIYYNPYRRDLTDNLIIKIVEDSMKWSEDMLLETFITFCSFNVDMTFLIEYFLKKYYFQIYPGIAYAFFYAIYNLHDPARYVKYYQKNIELLAQNMNRFKNFVNKEFTDLVDIQNKFVNMKSSRITLKQVIKNQGLLNAHKINKARLAADIGNINGPSYDHLNIEQIKYMKNLLNL